MAGLPLKRHIDDRSRLDCPAVEHDALTRGREIVRSELAVLDQVAKRLDQHFADAADILYRCHGKVVTCGIGKAGIVGQKLTASLSSTGTPSMFLHPGEAVHGDLGCLQPTDVVIVLSNSGETDEVVRLLPLLRESASRLIAITARMDSTLGKNADCTIALGQHSEACSLNLAPTSSTTAMMAIGDALALVVSERRQFTRDQFAQFHPGGSLGKRLSKVEDVMRPLSECRIAADCLTIREVIIAVSRPGRRTGAIMLVNHQGKLSGVFTDSDLARMLEQSCSDSVLDRPVSEVMSRRVRVCRAADRLSDALHILSSAKISELPVVNADDAPAGIIDVTDVVELAASQTNVSHQESTNIDAHQQSIADGPTILPIEGRMRGENR